MFNLQPKYLIDSDILNKKKRKSVKPTVKLIYKNPFQKNTTANTTK